MINNLIHLLYFEYSEFSNAIDVLLRGGGGRSLKQGKCICPFLIIIKFQMSILFLLPFYVHSFLEMKLRNNYSKPKKLLGGRSKS